MSARITALVEDLKVLRTGLGVEDPNLVARAGATVRQVSGVTDDDSPGHVREKIKTWLEHTITALPEAAARIGRATFGFDGAGDRSYLARLEDLGRRVDREVRTMQRRADQVLVRIAESAYTQPTATPEPHTSGPWHATLVQVDLILDQPEIEVLENRRIVSHTNGLSEIKHWLTIPPVDNPATPVDLEQLGITVLRGGDMGAPPRLVSANRVEFTLHPPNPLDAGEQHEFFFRLKIAELLPFYVCTPRFTCDKFHLRVRFGRDRIPGSIWLIDSELSMEAADPKPRRDHVRADNAGEVQVRFVDLQPGLSYGIGWSPR